MKLNKYQTVYAIVNAVCSLADVEELKQYIAENDTKPSDDDTAAHLVACKEALHVYEQDFFRRLSYCLFTDKIRRVSAAEQCPFCEHL